MFLYHQNETSNMYSITNIRWELLMLPFFNVFLGKLISVLIAGAALLFLIQLLLDALPLLHQWRHFDLTLFWLQRHMKVNCNAKHNWKVIYKRFLPHAWRLTLSFFNFLVLSVVSALAVGGSQAGGAGGSGGWGGWAGSGGGGGSHGIIGAATAVIPQ